MASGTAAAAAEADFAAAPLPAGVFASAAVPFADVPFADAPFADVVLVAARRRAGVRLAAVFFGVALIVRG